MGADKMIEIVTHCYCPPTVDVYARMLRWQFSSLHRNDLAERVQWSICYTPGDRLTSSTLVDVMRANRRIGAIVGLALEPGELFRRAIGRNKVSKISRADIVWYTDVDYLFEGSSLSDCFDICVDDGKLYHPVSVLTHASHELGDSEVRSSDTMFPIPHKANFKPKRTRAIGGVQIVTGNTARRIGYLAGTRYMKPVDASAGFRSCICDARYRSRSGLERFGVLIRDVYRLRHTVDGRDYNELGEKQGREVW